MGERETLQVRARQAFSGRDCLWFGSRGADARPLHSLLGLKAVVSFICPVDAPDVESEACLERLAGFRVETNTFDPEKVDIPELAELRSALLTAGARPSSLIPYRSSRFLNAAVFPRLGTLELMGPPSGLVMQLDHKPWVETELRRAGVSVLPWNYAADQDIQPVEEALDSGPVVLRATTTGGGVGIHIVRDAEDLAGKASSHEDGFFAFSPYLEGAVPLNVHGCVFRDGSVTLHSPSAQLIGTEECIAWPLGYCGNDFALPRSFSAGVIEDLEAQSRRVGAWLHGKGYLGAFGIDALVHEGAVSFVELNPRFQGSSASAAALDEKMDLPDVYLDHVSAYLGEVPGGRPALRTIAEEQPPFAQVICYNQHETAVRLASTGRLAGQGDPSHAPAEDVAVVPGGKLFQINLWRGVTEDGRGLDRETAAAVLRLRAEFTPVPGSAVPA